METVRRGEEERMEERKERKDTEGEIEERDWKE